MSTCAYIRGVKGLTQPSLAFGRWGRIAGNEVAMAQAGEHSWELSISCFLDDDDVVYEATQIFDALSDYTRFRILSALCDKSRSVSELQELCRVSQSAISHQLRMLRDRGLVTARREGQRVIYSLADEHVATLIEVGLSHAAELAGKEGE